MRHPIEAEFSAAKLGDKRLSARLTTIATSLAEDPSLSLPDALGRGAGLEGGYRFFNNEHVAPEAVLEPHITATGERARAHEVVLVLHDTTDCRFTGSRAELLEVQEGQARGFRCHVSLAVTADGRREPLGVGALKTWTRETPAGKRAASTRERREDAERESKRWLEQSVRAEEALRHPALIHIEDREADIFESFAGRLEKGIRFIVRAQNQRMVKGSGDDEVSNVAEHMRKQPRDFVREVRLSRRHKSTSAAKKQKSNPPRDGRTARLAIAAASVELRRPRADSGSDVRQWLPLNAVHVIEIDAPHGEAAVEWLLFTTEPISSEAEIAQVVDHYRTRWVIEEYFKALKTGCNYEARQLGSYEGLYRALSVFAVLAWRLLWVRTLAQHTPDAPARDYAAEDEIAVLKARKLLKSDTLAGFLDAVAALGGHLKHNGPPGWQVLWRGARKLELLAEGWALARCDQ